MTTTNGNGNGRSASMQAISIIVSVGTAVAVAFVTVGYLLISGQISDVRERAIENGRLNEKTADEFRAEIKGINTLLRETYATNGDAERIRNALTDLRKSTVTLDAHQAVLDRLTRLESTVGNITPVGDVLKEMQDQIKRLQGQIYQRDSVERERTTP